MTKSNKIHLSGIGKPPGQMDPKAFLLQKFNATARERVCLFLQLLFLNVKILWREPLPSLVTSPGCDLIGRTPDKSLALYLVLNHDTLNLFSLWSLASLVLRCPILGFNFYKVALSHHNAKSCWHCLLVVKIDAALQEGVDALKQVLSKGLTESARCFNTEQKYKHLRLQTMPV